MRGDRLFATPHGIREVGVSSTFQIPTSEDGSLALSIRYLRALAGALLLLTLALGGCQTALKWEGDRPVSDWTLASLFGIDPDSVSENLVAPDVPVPQRLRPCCAFGVDLRVAVGRTPVPGFSLGNVVGADDLGPHNYDSPALALERSHAGQSAVTNERNGLVYTCNGGFIDVAHLRDHADWTIFFTAQIVRRLPEGGVIPLPDEGGERRVVVHGLPDALSASETRRLAVELGQWLSFELGVWHEIATWYGWSSLSTWPERVSAFSPEDLYSNLVGVKVGAATIYDRAADATPIYNRAMTYAIGRVLGHLGAVDKESGRAAMVQVDGLWWDSSRRLPDERLVMRRHLDVGEAIAPWHVTGLEACDGNDAPLALPYPDHLPTLRFRDAATLEITVEEALHGVPIPPDRERRITQDDFTAILAAIREENAAEFGKGTDEPGDPQAFRLRTSTTKR